MNTKQDIQDLSTWLGSKERPFIISGPCSAESLDQLMDTALELATIPEVCLFRAGIWKPRTRPGGFEGHGEEALKWMQQVKAATSLKTAVEIANPKHIELCLNYGIDVIWIGARTVVNPFSVDEISEALKGVDIPVMIKNPVNPDLDLWIGAIERIQKAGISKLAAIHRGFYCADTPPYRNNPMWEIPIELKRIIPHLPIICDPSHISGTSEGLQHISQQALDLMMDGLMIETHVNPAVALTDARQQITPAQLLSLLQNLRLRSKETPSPSAKFEELRRQIDVSDTELLRILAKRIDIVKKLAVEKKIQNTTIYQADRWRQIMDDRLKKAESLSLDKSFVLKLMQMVHKESIRIQTEIYSPDKD